MKQVNFLGLTINVIDDEDIARAAEEGKLHHYVVVRVAEMAPGDGSDDLRRRRLRTLCEKCNHVCWMDPNSFDPLRGLKTMIICMQCELVEVRKHQG